MKNNKEKNPFSWESVSISDYVQITRILSDESKTDLQKTISLVSILTGRSERDIYSLPISESSKLISQLEFLNNFNINKNPKFKSLIIGDKKYEVITDITKLSTAQFIDYQSASTLKPEEALVSILSVFIIPEGKKYGEGYDINELRKDIYEKLNFITAQELTGFIISKYRESLETSLTYLENHSPKDPHLKNHSPKDPKQGSLRAAIRKLRTRLTSSPGSAL